MAVRTGSRWGVGVALCLGMAACLSPTLPLPPPESPDSVGLSNTPGEWDVRGTCSPGAVVLIKNTETGLIWGTEDKDGDGRYFVTIEAEECDTAELTQLLDNESSDGTFFLIETTVNGLPEGNCSF